MRFFTKILFFVFIFCSFIYGQNDNRLQTFAEFEKLSQQIKRQKKPANKVIERKQKLFGELLSIPTEDVEKAKQINAKVIRLFPCCVMEKLTDLSDVYEFSYRSLTNNDVYFAPKISYSDNKLKIVKFEGNHGFIINIGKTPIENIYEQTKEFTALSQYLPPKTWSEIKTSFNSNNSTFQRNVDVIEGDTYLLRAISYETSDENIDKIYALKVQRKDADGSIVIFLKQLKEFAPPKLYAEEKENFRKYYWIKRDLIEKIYKALRKNGFKNIDVQIADDYPASFILLSGTVPKGRMANALKIVSSIAKIPIKNEMTEK